jgi:hypothetical protein
MSGSNLPPGGDRTSSIDEAQVVLRYCREHFQRRLTEIVKLAGVTSPQAIEAFMTKIGETHDDFATASSARPQAFGSTGLTASRISLVHNEDLEIDIRIGDITSRLKDNEQIDHWRVQLRYMTLLQRPLMTPQNNPLGLEVIRRGLWAICRASGDDPQRNLELLERIEEQLQARLPEVYTELNGLLEHHRVEAATAQIIRQPGARTSGGGGGGGGSGGGGGGSGGSEGGGGGGGGGGEGGAPAAPPNALFSLQQALRQRFAGDEATTVAVFTNIGATGNTIITANSAVLSASAMVMLNHLTERMNALESQQAARSGGTDADVPLPLQAIKSKDLDLPLGKPTAIALDTLSLIFEAIFATAELPDVVKAAISRLQIPLIKVAILDASFFSNEEHPARRLVNRMARAAIGLPGDASRDHPVCVSLSKIADSVRQTFESDNGDLTPLLDELDALIAERDQSVHAGAQPYIQLVVEHEARESSRTSAEDWLAKTLAKAPPYAIANFISQYWVRVMQDACLDGGTVGDRWKECALAIDDLLWTLLPKVTVEDRQKSAALIPALIKRINAGLDLIAVANEDRVPFFNACFALQTTALRNRPEVLAPRPVPPLPPAAPAKPAFADPGVPDAVRILEQHGKLVQYLGRPGALASWRSGGHSWKEGDWISFQLPDGERLCGRVSWQGASFGTVLLFNKAWGYAVAIGAATLEQQLRGGRASVVSNVSLFDEAARMALGQVKRG